MKADEAGSWTYKFTDLPKYEAGEEIVYTVTEDAVEGYTTELDGNNFINTHVPETTEISGTKTWDDNSNQDGLRPEKVELKLYRKVGTGDEELVQGVKATWTNGLVHNIIRSLVQNGYLKECGMEQFGRQYARKLMPALTREEYIAKLMIQKSEGKSSVKQMVVALAKESEDMEQVIEELEEIIRKLKEEQ